MPSEKLIRILKAKSPFSVEEIESLTEIDGWNWVYSNAKPAKDKLTQVCFTGFSTAEKTKLSTMAVESNLAVVSSVTKNLAFLCAGENAGPAKLEKAKGQGALVLNRMQFIQLLETGEIPSI